jgi:hypothetical protein
MSLITNTGINLFPAKFIKECIEQYTKTHGKSPKILVLSKEDLIDYKISCTLPAAESLGLERITLGDYLKTGEIDLAMGIKNENS